MDEFNFLPKFPDLDVIKLLYTTKLSKIWIVKHDNVYKILKGRKKSEITSQDFEQLKTERALLEENKHEVFPKMIKSYKDDIYLYMLLDLKEGLELSNLLREEKKFPKELIAFLAAQMIDILVLLKCESIIYRDLKLNNIIIDMNFQLKLIDFDFAKKLDIDDRTYTICGTYNCKAPENLNLLF